MSTPVPQAGWLGRLAQRSGRAQPRLPAPRVRRLAAEWSIPVLVFVLAEIVVLLAAVANSSNPFDDATWAHWDSGHYLRSALHGASLYRCASIGEMAPTGAPADAFCGDSAWFLGYSAQMAGARAIGLPLGASGVVISTFWSFATIVAAWVGLLDRRRDVPAVAALVFVAFIPGAVYFHAIFPMSCAAFFVVCLFAMLRRGRWVLAALAGGAGCLMHSSVPLAIPVVVLWLLLGRDEAAGTAERVRRAAIVGGGMAAGTLISLAVIALQTGVVGAYFEQQASYGTAFHLPTSRWWSVVHPLMQSPTTVTEVTGVQVLFVTVLLLTLFARAAWRGATGIHALAIAYLAVFWIYPLSQQQISLWRADCLGLLPAALLIARMRPAGAVVVAGGAVALAAPLTVAFVSNSII